MNDPTKPNILVLTLVEGSHGSRCVYLGDYRIAGQKPLGGGQTIASFVVSIDDVVTAIEDRVPALSKREARSPISSESK